MCRASKQSTLLRWTVQPSRSLVEAIVEHVQQKESRSQNYDLKKPKNDLCSSIYNLLHELIASTELLCGKYEKRKHTNFEHRMCGIITLLNYHSSEHFQEQVGCLKQKCLVRNVRVQSRRRQHDDINQVSEVNDEVVFMNRRMYDWLRSGYTIYYCNYAKTYIRCVCRGSMLAIRWTYRERTHPSVVWVCLVAAAVCVAWIPWASIRCALNDFSFSTIAWMVIYSTMSYDACVVVACPRCDEPHLADPPVWCRRLAVLMQVQRYLYVSIVG